MKQACVECNCSGWTPSSGAAITTRLHWMCPGCETFYSAQPASVKVSLLSHEPVRKLSKTWQFINMNGLITGLTCWCSSAGVGSLWRCDHHPFIARRKIHLTSRKNIILRTTTKEGILYTVNPSKAGPPLIRNAICQEVGLNQIPQDPDRLILDLQIRCLKN